MRGIPSKIVLCGAALFLLCSCGGATSNNSTASPCGLGTYLDPSSNACLLNNAYAIITDSGHHWECPAGVVAIPGSSDSLQALNAATHLSMEFFSAGSGKTGGTGKMTICYDHACDGDSQVTKANANPPINFTWGEGTKYGSMTISIETGPAPSSAPANVAATPKTERITNPLCDSTYFEITWEPVAGAGYYKVYSTPSPGASITVGYSGNWVANSPFQIYYDTPGTYTFEVSAIYNYAESPKGQTTTTDNTQGCLLGGGGLVVEGFDNSNVISANPTELTGITPNSASGPTSFSAQITLSSGTIDLKNCTLASGAF